MKSLSKKIILSLTVMALSHTSIYAGHPIEVQNETIIPQQPATQSQSFSQKVENKLDEAGNKLDELEAEAKAKFNQVENAVEQEYNKDAPKVKSFYQKHKTIITGLTIAAAIVATLLAVKYSEGLQNFLGIKKSVPPVPAVSSLSNLPQDVSSNQGVIDLSNIFQTHMQFITTLVRATAENKDYEVNGKKQTTEERNVLASAARGEIQSATQLAINNMGKNLPV